MKKMMSMILIALMILGGTALAEMPLTDPSASSVENVGYWGDGVFKLELMRNVAWRTGYVMTAADEYGTPMNVNVLGGDANDIYLQLENVQEDRLYTFSLVSDSSVIGAQGVATIGVKYPNHCEYCLVFGHDDAQCASRAADGIWYEIDRCELCGDLAHDDEHCPTRQVGTAYCDECAQYGHDDDVCIYDDDERDDWDEWCDYCGGMGHDDERCPTRQTVNIGSDVQPAPEAAQNTVTRQRRCDECGEYGHDDDNCPNERCDECREYGHDDDNCPNERCDECREYGHDDDNCPNERCDECGEYGHDDDNCPNERCDECGRKGHDDDRCPYDRD